MPPPRRAPSWCRPPPVQAEPAEEEAAAAAPRPHPSPAASLGARLPRRWQSQPSPWARTDAHRLDPAMTIYAHKQVFNNTPYMETATHL